MSLHLFLAHLFHLQCSEVQIANATQLLYSRSVRWPWEEEMIDSMRCAWNLPSQEPLGFRCLYIIIHHHHHHHHHPIGSLSCSTGPLFYAGHFEKWLYQVLLFRMKSVPKRDRSCLVFNHRNPKISAGSFNDRPCLCLPWPPVFFSSKNRLKKVQLSLCIGAGSHDGDPF